MWRNVLENFLDEKAMFFNGGKLWKNANRYERSSNGQAQTKTDGSA